MSSTCILLVEDEALIRVIIAESLADAGYDVVQAGSGDQAIQLLEELDHLDLLMTDIQMPGAADGNAVAQAAKKRHPGLPVIYVTGRPDTLHNNMGGTDAFIRKPFGPNEVLTMIQTRLAARHGLPAVPGGANWPPVTDRAAADAPPHREAAEEANGPAAPSA